MVEAVWWVNNSSRIPALKRTKVSQPTNLPRCKAEVDHGGPTRQSISDRHFPTESSLQECLSCSYRPLTLYSLCNFQIYSLFKVGLDLRSIIMLCVAVWQKQKIASFVRLTVLVRRLRRHGTVGHRLEAMLRHSTSQAIFSEDFLTR